MRSILLALFVSACILLAPVSARAGESFHIGLGYSSGGYSSYAAYGSYGYARPVRVYDPYNYYRYHSRVIERPVVVERPVYYERVYCDPAPVYYTPLYFPSRFSLSYNYWDRDWYHSWRSRGHGDKYWRHDGHSSRYDGRRDGYSHHDRYRYDRKGHDGGHGDRSWRHDSSRGDRGRSNRGSSRHGR